MNRIDKYRLLYKTVNTLCVEYKEHIAYIRVAETNPGISVGSGFTKFVSDFLINLYTYSISTPGFGQCNIFLENY